MVGAVLELGAGRFLELYLPGCALDWEEDGCRRVWRKLELPVCLLAVMLGKLRELVGGRKHLVV